MRGKYLSVFGENGKLGLFPGTQNHLRILEKYLNVFGEYAERIYAYMEWTLRDSWRILLIRQKIWKYVYLS